MAMAQSPAPASAPALVVSGVNYAPTAQVGGSTLLLNGAGTRYKFIIKVYTAGLYLTARAGTPDAVLAAAGPKRLHVVMLREIDANELGKLFTRGMQDNAPRESFSRSIPGTLRMAEIFSSRKKLLAGDNFSVDWVPGFGTTVLVNGQPQGAAIKEPEFFNALMSIWLGPRPADDPLKAALLGEQARPAGGRNRQ
ncbi:MAG: chalcone isomerase family protein [Rubrivivax sp.]|nr:chalcone isomerase family protein [Rubrivivax sp.]